MPLLKDHSIISAFRQMGYSPTFSKPRQTHGVPISIRELNEIFFNKFNKKLSGAHSILQKKWDSFLPKRFVGKCSFEGVKLSVVFARAESASARQEMQMEERSILKKIVAINECKNIKRIVFL